jgi:hypothetical protein
MVATYILYYKKNVDMHVGHSETGVSLVGSLKIIVRKTRIQLSVGSLFG